MCWHAFSRSRVDQSHKSIGPPVSSNTATTEAPGPVIISSKYDSVNEHRSCIHLDICINMKLLQAGANVQPQSAKAPY